MRVGLHTGSAFARAAFGDAVLNVECRTIGTHRLGHTLFIGEAIWARYDPAKSPLIFHGGKYFGVGPQVPKA